MAAPRLLRAFRPATVIASGFLVAAAGFAALTQLASTGAPWLLFTGMMLFCLGLSPIGTITTDLVMTEAPPARAGAASGISETSFELGGALGVAVLGSILTAVYRGNMENERLTGIPQQAIDAAKDTLGGAVAVAKDLPPEPQAALLGAAREAFVYAFEVTSAIAAVCSVLAAFLAWRFLRRAGRHGSQ
jgi:DHA2 family multidrug resistance protein-like MFS transporter